MKKFLLLLTLSFLLIGAESFAQRSFSSQSSFSSSRSSFSSSRSYSRPTISRSSYSPSRSYTSTRSSYTKPSISKSVIHITSIKSTPITKPVIKTNIKQPTKTLFTKNTVNTKLADNNKITHISKFSNNYIDHSKTYRHNNNLMLYSTLAVMWYTLYYNKDTRQYDTIKAPNKEALEKKVDNWSTK